MQGPNLTYKMKTSWMLSFYCGKPTSGVMHMISIYTLLYHNGQKNEFCNCLCSSKLQEELLPLNRV